MKNKEKTANRKNKAPPKGYDSWFEYDLATGPMKKTQYHPSGVPYVQRKTYNPDFVIVGYKGYLTVYFEAKGRFRDRQEARKYILS